MRCQWMVAVMAMVMVVVVVVVVVVMVMVIPEVGRGNSGSEGYRQTLYRRRAPWG